MVWTPANAADKLLSLVLWLSHPPQQTVGLHRSEGFMGFLSRQQIASGIALIVSVIYVVLLNVQGYDRHDQLYGIALVCVFTFLLVGPPEGQNASEAPWWW
jgi:hypothetical protein